MCLGTLAEPRGQPEVLVLNFHLLESGHFDV